MKTTSIIGLFAGQKTDRVIKSLLIGGVQPEAISSYLLDEHNSVISVLVKDKYEEQLVNNIFEFHIPSKIHRLHEEVKASEYQAYMNAKTLAQVSEAPIIRRRPPLKGISSEVTF